MDVKCFNFTHLMECEYSMCKKSVYNLKQMTITKIIFKKIRYKTIFKVLSVSNTNQTEKDGTPDNLATTTFYTNKYD